MKMCKSDNYNKTDIHIYQQLIGKLIYLVCGIRSDIALAVEQLSKHKANP